MNGQTPALCHGLRALLEDSVLSAQNLLTSFLWMPSPEGWGSVAACTKPWAPTPAPQKPTWHLRTGKMMAGSQEFRVILGSIKLVQGQPQLYGELEASLD